MPSKFEFLVTHLDEPDRSRRKARTANASRSRPRLGVASDSKALVGHQPMRPALQPDGRKGPPDRVRNATEMLRPLVDARRPSALQVGKLQMPIHHMAEGLGR